MRALPLIISAAAAALLVACGPSATKGGFDSPNPAARMYAIEQAARQGDRSAIHSLVESLDSDDPAVRLLAIYTLQRLTGQTFGYHHYDSAMQRRQAIARWVQAVNAGEIVPMNEQPPAASSTSPAAVPVPSSSSSLPASPPPHG